MILLTREPPSRLHEEKLFLLTILDLLDNLLATEAIGPLCSTSNHSLIFFCTEQGQNHPPAHCLICTHNTYHPWPAPNHPQQTAVGMKQQHESDEDPTKVTKSREGSSRSLTPVRLRNRLDVTIDVRCVCCAGCCMFATRPGPDLLRLLTCPGLMAVPMRSFSSNLQVEGF